MSCGPFVALEVFCRSQGQGPCQSVSPHSVSPYSVSPHSFSPHNVPPHSVSQQSVSPQNVSQQSVSHQNVSPHSVSHQNVSPHSVSPQSAQRFTPERLFHPQEAPQPGAHRERRSQEPTALPGCAPVDYATNEGGDSATCHKVNLIQLVSTPVRGVTGYISR